MSGSIQKQAAVPTEAAYRPTVRRLTAEDLRYALLRGLEDFRANRTDVIFLCLFYPIFGICLFAVATGANAIELVFPLAAGFALIGPFAATGLYQLSRRREHGLSSTWRNAFDVFREPSLVSVLILGGMLTVFYLVWLEAAKQIYVALFGPHVSETVGGFLAQVFTTGAGWLLILIGNVVGFVFALVVLTLSVVSLPMVLDRNCDPGLAIHTSIRVTIANPVAILTWGFIVAALLLLGSIPAFVGLAVVFPVLGHATWHLYRRAVF